MIRAMRPKKARMGVHAKARTLHTVVCVLHDCPQRLSESLSLLQSLGFRQSASSTSSTDNTSVKNLQIKRVWSGQLGIDLVEDSRLSSIRSLTRQRPLTTVLSVDTYGSAAVAAASASAAAERPFPSLLQQAEQQRRRLDLQTLAALAVGRRPPLRIRHTPLPAAAADDASASASGSASSLRPSQETAEVAAARLQLGIAGLREVVLPFQAGLDSSDGRSRGAVSAVMRAAGLQEGHHGIFSPPAPTSAANNGDHSGSSSGSGSTTAFRLFPSATVGVVLRVTDLQQAQHYLQSLPASFSRLGNALPDMEIQLAEHPLSAALDLRLTQSPLVRPFYREGTAAILADTIRSIQNDRVTAGDDSSNIAIDSRTLHGDCWSEVKAMGREKVKSAAGVSANASHTNNYSMRE